MSDRFDYFAILAGMRTGSNFLEANLNSLSGVTCLGEAFNPHFAGYPNKSEILGVSQQDRDADPSRLIDAFSNGPGLTGFRFFHDHDPRALKLVLENPRCAKIVLTRNPLDSYVSLKIARATGQWKLTDVKRKKEARAKFDEMEFTEHLEETQHFQLTILNNMQRTGQTAFFIAYEDLQDVDVLNGLAGWLGVDARLETLDNSLKPQNPKALPEKVTNPADMSMALSRLDRFNLSRTPNFEPRRGPSVPGYFAGANTPLLYLPVKTGIEDSVVEWMARLDAVAVEELETGFNQKRLRQWLRRNKAHRSFLVVRHPVARAHTTFCRRILMRGPGNFQQIRNALRKKFKVEIPQGDPGQAYTVDAHCRAFKQFLAFLKSNLAGQTPIRVDASWCTQSQAVAGFSELLAPDFVMREADLPALLQSAAALAGHSGPYPEWVGPEPDAPFALSEVYDDEIEEMAANVYQRDYLMFGFGPWASGQAA